MRSRTQEHREAVARRLALLSEQLAAAREGAADGPDESGDVVEDIDGARVLAPASGADWWVEHTHVAAPRQRTPLTVVPDPDPAAVPAPVPVPGRHAARRAPVGRVSRALPETLRGRVRFGPGGLAVVAALVAAALAMTCWWVVRGDADPPAPVVPTAPQPGGDLVAVSPVGAESAPAETAAPAAPDGSAESGGSVTVDVAGKVRRPGIVVLDPGARVVDALERAGGARPGVDLTTVNLARPLVDGEQILVGVDPPPGTLPAGVPPAAGETAPAAPTALVDLNLASAEQLDTLPNVGPVTAAAIIAWRDEHGGFSAVTELLEVDGIGDATLADLTPLVTV